jgi:hypothetical protein
VRIVGTQALTALNYYQFDSLAAKSRLFKMANRISVFSMQNLESRFLPLYPGLLNAWTCGACTDCQTYMMSIRLAEHLSSIRGIPPLTQLRGYVVVLCWSWTPTEEKALSPRAWPRQGHGPPEEALLSFSPYGHVVHSFW